MRLAGDLADELRSGVTGEVSASPDDLDRWATNYGGTVWRPPAVVVRALSQSDVAHTLALCRDAGVTVSLRGSGHCFGAQGLSDGGVLLVNRVREPPALLEDGSVEVATGTTWEELQLALNHRGRSVPVLTSELTVTVGGTLAVGGYGEGSLGAGGQIDLVERARLVRPDGTAVECSPTERGPLFRLALASLGQVGFVERVVLRTIPHRDRTHVVVDRYPTLAALVDSVTAVAGERSPRPDLFAGQRQKGSFVGVWGVRGGDDASRQAAEDLTATLARLGRPRLQRVFDWQLRSLGSGRRRPWSSSHFSIWSDYVVEGSRAASFVDFLERRVLKRGVFRRGNGRLLLLATRADEHRHRFAFEPIAPSMSGLVFGFGLYLDVPRSDRESLAKIHSLQRETLARCLECGGRPYLAGWYDLDAATLREIYGDDLEELRRLRRALDPRGLFNPGLLSPGRGGGEPASPPATR